MSNDWELIKKYNDTVLKPFLPNASVDMFFAYINDFLLDLDNFQIFKDACFEATNVKKLLHFTSITNLVQIINSKSILMSDLNLFKDKKEFNLGIISSLYKNEDYTYENEVRLLKYYPNIEDYSPVFNEIDLPMLMQYGKNKNKKKKKKEEDIGEKNIPIFYRYRLPLENKSFMNISIQKIFFIDIHEQYGRINNYLEGLIKKSFCKNIDFKPISLD